jgi:predicted acyl esterase
MIGIYWGFVADTAKEESDDVCLAQLQANKKQEPATSPLQKLLAGSVQAQDRSYELLQDVGKIKVPVLSLESFQDQSTSVRGGNYQKYLNPSNYWLVQTNGHHDVYLASEYHKTVIKFLDRFVKGQKNGFEQSQPKTTIWMESYATGTDLLSSFTSVRPSWTVEKGRISDSDLQVKEFHLGAGGVLGSSTTGGAADSFDYSSKGVAVGSFEGTTNWGALPTDWQQQSLAYTSPQFESDAMVYGTGSADLWVVTGAGDADVQVTITEVRPDGQEVYVQRGWLRMSGRKLDDSKSTPLLPVRTNKVEDVRPLDPSAAVLGRIEILKMGHYFRQGSRLRVWVDTPSDTGGYSFDTYAQQQKIYVLHNQKYDSVVRLGILPDVKGPSAYPECGKSLNQPCRPDPLSAK